MSSLRHRTLWLVLGLLVLGTLTITLYNFNDSSHEITEIYDAQLAQTARLLQGVVHMPLPEDQRQKLYQAFNDALTRLPSTKLATPTRARWPFRCGALKANR